MIYISGMQMAGALVIFEILLLAFVKMLIASHPSTDITVITESAGLCGSKGSVPASGLDPPLSTFLVSH